MSILKRAGLYCLRQRVKSLILFLILTLAAALVLTGIAVGDAAKDATAEVQNAIGGKIILETDSEGNMSKGQNQWGTVYTYHGDMITQEMVEAIRKVEGVVDCNVEEEAGYYGAGVDFQ